MVGCNRNIIIIIINNIHKTKQSKTNTSTEQFRLHSAWFDVSHVEEEEEDLSAK